MLSLICSVCQSPFTVHAYRAHKANILYCSKVCSDKAKERRVVVLCIYCNTPFTVTEFWAKRRSYCSQQCAQRSKRRRNASHCHTCLKSVTIHAYKVRLGSVIYCSRACHNVAMRNTAADFWAMVQRCPHGEDCPYCCWEWHKKTVDGYGSFSWDGRNIGSHRLAWTLHNQQPIPPGLWICHYCHNRACCNPFHLHAGTMRDNVADAINDGRLTRSLYPKKGTERRKPTLRVRLEEHHALRLQALQDFTGRSMAAMVSEALDVWLVLTDAPPEKNVPESSSSAT